jgi:hypothetical protein
LLIWGSIVPTPNVTPIPVSKPDAGADATASEPSTSTPGEDDDPADLAKAVAAMLHTIKAASVISANLFILDLLNWLCVLSKFYV